MSVILGQIRILYSQEQLPAKCKKFDYLQTQLMGQANETLIDIKLANDNYSTRVALLKE